MQSFERIASKGSSVRHPQFNGNRLYGSRTTSPETRQAAAPTLQRVDDPHLMGSGLGFRWVDFSRRTGVGAQEIRLFGKLAAYRSA
jgi:hypothetical protein